MSAIIITKNDRNQYETSRLLDSFANKGIEAHDCHPDDFDLIVDTESHNGIKYRGKDLDMPKIVLCRFGAGILPFQLATLRQFEQNGVACVNSSISIDVVRDKLRTSQILSRHNLPTPKTMLVRWPVDDGLVEQYIGFPCVIKVVTGSYGEGIYLCERKRDYKKLMEFIANLGAKKTMLVQQYISHRPGEDLRVYVVGGKVLGAMKRTAPEGDFRANITGGGSGQDYPVDSIMEYLALETAKLMGLDIAGIDLLFDKEGYKICEANSNPGFQGFEKYVGIDVADRITDYIRFKMLSK
jgi:gamma-F420-2:alpha-L-glutamate ligase